MPCYVHAYVYDVLIALACCADQGGSMWLASQPGCAGLAAPRRCCWSLPAVRQHAVVQQRDAPQLPDPYLFASIKGCGSLDQCAGLLDAHGGRLSAMLICTLAIQTVQLSSRQKQGQPASNSSHGSQALDSNTSSSSSSSSSSNSSSECGGAEKRQRYLTRLARLATKRLGDFRPQQMSSLLWAFARLGYTPPPTWLARYLAAVERALVDFSPGRLSQLIWALARLGVTPPTSLLNSFLSESLDKLHTSSPRDLSNTLWALAQLQVVVPPDYVTTAMSAAQQQWAAFQVHELCVFAWGLAKQPASPGVVTKEWVGELVTLAGVRVPQGSSREAGMLLWALARWKGMVHPWQLDQVAAPALQLLAKEVAALESLACGSGPSQHQISSSRSRVQAARLQHPQQQQEQAESNSGSSSKGVSPDNRPEQPEWRPQSLATASYHARLQQEAAAQQAAAAAEVTCHAAAVGLSSLATLGWRPQLRQEQQQHVLLQVVGGLTRHAPELRHVATLWWSVAALGLKPPPQLVADLEQQSLRFMQQQQQQQQQRRTHQQQVRPTLVLPAAAAGRTAVTSSSSCSGTRVVGMGDILQLLLACARLKWRPSDVWWGTCYSLLLSNNAPAPHSKQQPPRPLMEQARAEQLAQLVSCIAAVHGPPPPEQLWQRLFERYEHVTQNISYWRRSGALAAEAAAAGAGGRGESCGGVQDSRTKAAGRLEQEKDAEAAADPDQLSLAEAEFVLMVGRHMQQQERHMQQQQAAGSARNAAAAAAPEPSPARGWAQQHDRGSSQQQQAVGTGGLPGKSIVWLLWACAKHEVVPPSRLMVALLQQLLRKLPELGLSPCAALAWALWQLCRLGRLRQVAPCTRLLCVVVLGVALRGRRLLHNMLPPSNSSSSSSSKVGNVALPAEARRLKKQLLALVAVGGLRGPLQQMLERRKRYVQLNRHRQRRGLPPLTGAQLEKGLLAW